MSSNNVSLKIDDNLFMQVAQDAFDYQVDVEGVEYKCDSCGTKFNIKSGDNVCLKCGFRVHVEKGTL